MGFLTFFSQKMAEKILKLHAGTGGTTFVKGMSLLFKAGDIVRQIHKLRGGISSGENHLGPGGLKEGQQIFQWKKSGIHCVAHLDQHNKAGGR